MGQQLEQRRRKGKSSGRVRHGTVTQAVAESGMVPHKNSHAGDQQGRRQGYRSGGGSVGGGSSDGENGSTTLATVGEKAGLSELKSRLKESTFETLSFTQSLCSFS